MVASAIPMDDVDPNDDPMDQFRKTEKVAHELKEFVEKLWLSLSRGSQTAQSLSDICNMLQIAVVT